MEKYNLFVVTERKILMITFEFSYADNNLKS